MRMQRGTGRDRIDAGATLSVDIRLPMQANDGGFPMLHVVVDSHREIPEVNEANWTTFALLSPLAGLIYPQSVWNEQHSSPESRFAAPSVQIGTVSHLRRRICM